MGRLGLILSQSKHKWQALVKTLIKPSGSRKCGEIFDYLRNCWFLKKDCDSSK
jgi:hypothetical protein